MKYREWAPHPALTRVECFWSAVDSGVTVLDEDERRRDAFDETHAAVP